MAADCALVVKENVDVHLNNIVVALRSNYLALFTGVLLVVAALYLSCLIASVAIGSVRSYYALLPGTKTPRAHAGRKRIGGAGVGDDDTVYPDEEAAAAGAASNLHDSDNSRIRAKIALLKSKYAAYNTASAEYAKTHSTYEPNLMDEQILSRAHDDFVPPAGSAPGSGFSSVFTQRAYAPTPSLPDLQTSQAQGHTVTAPLS